MQCPYCKGDIPDDAVKCMHCGEWVKQRPVAAEPPRAEPEPASVIVMVPCAVSLIALQAEGTAAGAFASIRQ